MITSGEQKSHKKVEAQARRALKKAGNSEHDPFTCRWQKTKRILKAWSTEIKPAGGCRCARPTVSDYKSDSMRVYFSFCALATASYVRKPR
jgi:hypothetical protein